MPQVIIEQPGLPSMTVSLSGTETTFGRSARNDVILVADEVSRQHAKIYRRATSSIVQDLKSLNGTFVNGERVHERTLKNMDEVRFGSKCRLVFHDDVPAEGGHDTTLHGDQRLIQSINNIRAEMDLVGKNMTLMGRQGTIEKQRQTPVPNEAELVRIGRAYRRLAALNKVNQVIASSFDLNKRLSSVLDTVIELLDADRGFVMLRDENSKALLVKVARGMGYDLESGSPSMGIAGRSAIDGEPVLMADRDQNEEFGSRESIVRNRISSAMCVPLRIEDRLLGSIYLDTCKATVRFAPEDMELFSSLASQCAMAIENSRLYGQIVESEKRRQNLARFLPNALVEQIINESQTLELGGQKAQVTTMFCDIRGSSKLAERLTPHELVEMLNEFFTAMTEVIFQYQGTLDKYIGDEIMAVFGAPIATGDEPYRAVRAALDMIRQNTELNILRAKENRPKIEMGVGIDCGEVIAGYIGSPKRMDFTVVGDRVNTAKRLCDVAGPGHILIGEGVWQAVQDRVAATPLGLKAVKGKEQAVHIYDVTGLKG